MRAIFVLAATALLLAGCAGNPSPTAQKIAATIDSTVVKVQDTAATIQAKAKVAQGYAEQICGYRPVLASAIAIFNSGFSSSIDVVANAICNAVTTLPLADGPGDRKPRVNGVVVKGAFVK